jgi:hypothetical protein
MEANPTLDDAKEFSVVNLKLDIFRQSNLVVGA